MKYRIRRIGGLSLVGIGVLLLLQSINLIVGDFGNILLAVILGTSGISFTYLFISNRNHWWWLIPGITLIGLALSNLIELFPGTDLLRGDFFTFIGVGLGFILIYFNDRINWWALIPGGVIVSIGASNLVEQLSLQGFDPGGTLFLGIGLTFFILYAIPTPYGRLTWAAIPAILLTAFGLLIGFEESSYLIEYLVPGFFVLAGLILLIRTARKR